MEDKTIFKSTVRDWTFPVRITCRCKTPEEGKKRIEAMFGYERMLSKIVLKYNIGRPVLINMDDFSPTVPKPHTPGEGYIAIND
jgi:hypothetical protein